MIGLIRKLIPTRLRIYAYVLVISLVRRNRTLLGLYLFLLHGHQMKGISIQGGKPVYHYRDITIDSPKDSLEAYVEVFCENVYDRVSIPRLGDTVIDIGAYVGMFAIKSAYRVGPSGSVIAVEPLPSNISYLEKNTASLENVTVVRAALSDYTGVGRLYSSPSTAAHSMTYVRRDFVEVIVTTLDEMVRELGIKRIDYIKMDAEGSDLNVLRGAVGTLSRHSPVLSVACYHTNSDGVPYTKEVVRFLDALGYRCTSKSGYIYASKERRDSVT